MTEDFDTSPGDEEDWRKLASFGVERNQVSWTSNCWLQWFFEFLFYRMWCQTTVLRLPINLQRILYCHFSFYPFNIPKTLFYTACFSFHRSGFWPRRKLRCSRCRPRPWRHHWFSWPDECRICNAWNELECECLLQSLVWCRVQRWVFIGKELVFSKIIAILTSLLFKTHLHVLCDSWWHSTQNPYMGFADFRAAFTPDTPVEFTVSPKEGSLKQKESTLFTIKFKAQQPSVVGGYLVIETEDFKKTWKVVGRTW